jgi:hypothetical protein
MPFILAFRLAAPEGKKERKETLEYNRPKIDLCQKQSFPPSLENREQPRKETLRICSDVTIVR